MTAELPSDQLSPNIVPTRELRDNEYQPAQTLRQTSIKRILGREIIAWNNSLGSYGMGGPGFFGLKMAAHNGYPAEWLVLIVWAADNWLLFDGQWVAAHSNQYSVQHPLTSNFVAAEDWDGLSSKLLHTTIVGAEIVDKSSRIRVEKNDRSHLLELPEDTSRLPMYGGTLTKRVWNDDESHLDAWIISQRGDLII